jgi:thiamine-monophosphate kinase
LAAPDPPAPESRRIRPAPGETLAQLGELELIRRLAVFAAPGRFDDDAAVLLPPPGQALVINTDVLVDAVHFSDATTAPADVGWRATVANLSDLAAMGCTSTLGITVALTAPGTTPWPWVHGVYAGIEEALQAHGGELLGGDCSSGRQRQLAITALGALDPARVIRRCDGRAGDLLVASGPHGLSRLGLALLQADGEGNGGLGPGPISDELRRHALQAHRRPRPRFDAVAALHDSQPAWQGWRVGGTDSSDGLAAAAAAIAAASGCLAVLERQRLPLDPAMAALPQAEDWCLAGGEDFELVLALEPCWGQALCRALPSCRVVGQLRSTDRAGCGSVVWHDSGMVIGPERSGYRHFS